MVIPATPDVDHGTLHQTGLVERIAAVFALAAAGEQFVCCKPVVDLRVRPDRPNDLDGYLDVSGGGTNPAAFASEFLRDRLADRSTLDWSR
jgi:hypothetical protein